MKLSKKEQKEKQVIAWLQEQDELYQMRRNREVIELNRPEFRGYTLSFRLTRKGKNNMSERDKELFHLVDPIFFVKDKQIAKNIKPNWEDKNFGEHHRDPDAPNFQIGHFWPLIVITRNGVRHDHWQNKVYSFELKGHRFKQIETFELYNGTVITYHALKIREDYFEVQVQKYKQKRAWVEDAYIDSRLSFLRTKLYDEKNWHKYGPDHGSFKGPIGKQPEGLYQQKIVGISPSKPYKRSIQKEQSKTLINKAKQNELK